MAIIMHPPGNVSFSGGPLPADEQARIARVLRAAVQEAIENAAQDGGLRRARGRSGTGEMSQTFDPARAGPAPGSYLVPSYQDAGKLTGVKLLELIPRAAPGYDVKDEPSPLEGGLIMILPGNHYVNIRSPRYVTAGTLSQAYLLGLAVFGATSFAILQGPWGSPAMRYWAVGTDPAVSDADLGQPTESKTEAGEEAVPAELTGRAAFVVGEELEGQLTGRDGDYLTRGLVTKDRMVHWKAVPMAAVWFAQLEAEQRKGVAAPPAQQVRRLVFAEVDRLVAEIEGGDDTNLQRAAELLSRMDRVAFGLVDWETKVRYLKVLLAAWTWQEEETAVVQIFASLDNGQEVDAVVALLKQAGRYNQ